MKNLSTEKEYVRGGAIHASATSVLIKTGAWRVFRPVIDHEKCRDCKICYWYCTDNCIEWLTLKRSLLLATPPLSIDYDYCKGCGICANECPSGAIQMEREEVMV